MPIVFESNSTNLTDGTTATSLSLADPSGITTDDICLIMAASGPSNPTTNAWWSDPSGATFTKIDEVANNDDYAVAAWYRVWDGTETALSVNPGVQEHVCACAIRISGVDTADPLDSVTSVETSGGGTSSSRTLTGVTTNTDGAVAIAVQSADGSDWGPCTITTWTEYLDLTTHSSRGAAGAICYVAYIETDPAGASGSAAITGFGNTDGNGGFVFALKPAAGGGGGTSTPQGLLGISQGINPQRSTRLGGELEL